MYRWGLGIIVAAVLQTASAWSMAQGFDYYAPRTKGEDITRLKNVEGYHLGPAQEKMAKRLYLYAMQELGFILGYYPNHPQALSLLSKLCDLWRDPKCDADGAFQRAVKRNPDAAHTYLLHGVHLHRKRQLNEAVKAYRRAVELQPNSGDAHYNLGLAYADLKQFDLANRHAQTSYKLGDYPPGLRRKLEQAGGWNPNVSAAAAESTKPADGPQQAAVEEKPQ